MGKEYQLRDGRVVFVGSNTNQNLFKAFFKKPNPKKESGYDTPHGIKVLPWMGNAEWAQEKLDDAVKEQKGIFKGAVLINDHGELIDPVIDDHDELIDPAIDEPFYLEKKDRFLVAREFKGNGNSNQCDQCFFDITDEECQKYECYENCRKDKTNVYFERTRFVPEPEKPFKIPGSDIFYIAHKSFQGEPSGCANCALDDKRFCLLVNCDPSDVIGAPKLRIEVYNPDNVMPDNDIKRKDKNVIEKSNCKTFTVEPEKKPDQKKEQEGSIEEMNPDELMVLPELQIRVAMNNEAIDDYCNLIRSGMAYKFPPLEAIKDESGAFLLYDGFHRLEAYKRVADEGDYQSVMVRWKTGTLEDALWFAIAANQEHGIRRTNEDKRKAVMKALEHPRGKELSDRAIADWVGVSHPTVSAIRKSTGKVYQLDKNKDKDDFNWKSLPVEAEARIGKDGKRRKLPTRISSEPSFSTPPEPEKPPTPEDWFMKSEKRPTELEREQIRTAFKRKIDDLYDWLVKNKLVTEYDHEEEANLTIFKGMSCLGSFAVPFLPPHQMPDED